MTQKTNGAQKLNAQDKAERTSQAAASIMSEERKASDAKVARLKAMRLARDPAPPEATEPRPPAASPPAKKAKAATLRKLALNSDGASAKRRAS